MTEEDERGWPLSEGGSSTGAEDEDEEDEGEAASEDERHFPLVIPDNLRAVLERDYHLINDKNKVKQLCVGDAFSSLFLFFIFPPLFGASFIVCAKIFTVLFIL